MLDNYHWLSARENDLLIVMDIRDLKQRRRRRQWKNVAKKMNLRPFKLNRVYLDPQNMSNAGDFSWSWILKDFIQVEKEEGKFVVVCPRPL